MNRGKKKGKKKKRVLERERNREEKDVVQFFPLSAYNSNPALD